MPALRRLLAATPCAALLRALISAPKWNSWPGRLGPAHGVVLLVLLTVGCQGPGHAPGATRLTRDLGPLELDGAWHGVFVTNAGPVHVALELNEVDAAGETTTRRYEGPARFGLLKDVDSAGRATSGSAAARAHYRVTHDTLAQTVRFEQLQLDGPDPRAFSRRLDTGTGVVDTSRHRLAGLLMPGRVGFGECFVFARPDDFDDLSDAYARFQGPGPGIPTNAPQGRQGRKVSFGDLFGGPDRPDPEVLRAWSAGLGDGGPRGRPAYKRPGFGDLASLDLFADEHFERHFDGRFDELDEDTVDGIHARLLQDMRVSSIAEDKVVASLAGMFKRSDQGPGSGFETLQGVLARRSIASWQRAQVERLEAAADPRAAWDLAQAMAALDGWDELTLLRPDESEATWERVAAVRARGAFVGLDHELESLESLPASQDALRTVARWRLDNYDDLPTMDDASRRALLDRWEAIMMRITRELAAPLLARLTAQERSVAALVDGAEAYTQLRDEFSWSWELDAMTALREDFRRERDATLQAVLPELVERVAGLSRGELGRVPDAWFALPDDRRGAAWSAVAAAIEERHERIDEAMVRAEVQALAEARPGEPLRFIDMRRFPSSELFELIYFGTGQTHSARDALVAWDRADMTGLYESTEFIKSMKLAFRAYHEQYGRVFGRTAQQRAAHGGEWTGITTVTTTRNGFGTVVDRDESEPHTWVRTPYAALYAQSQPTEGDLLGSLLFGAAATEQGGGDTPPRSLMDVLFQDVEPLLTSMRAFIEEYGTEHPATLRHFEANLEAALTGRPLTRLDVPEL